MGTPDLLRKATELQDDADKRVRQVYSVRPLCSERQPHLLGNRHDDDDGGGGSDVLFIESKDDVFDNGRCRRNVRKRTRRRSTYGGRIFCGAHWTRHFFLCVDSYIHIIPTYRLGHAYRRCAPTQSAHCCMQAFAKTTCPSPSLA